MPELPWKKFFPQDWRGDPKLSRCSAMTRGIWMDAIAAMMLLGTDRVSGTDAELARDCRCSEPEIQAAHKELQRTNAADVSMQNGCKTWICRRMSRELAISHIRSKSASARWHKTDANDHAKAMQQVDANGHASSASVSASASASSSVPPTVETFERPQDPPTGLVQVPKWVFDWVEMARKSGADYTNEEAKAAFIALEGNGWKYGRGDARAAVESQITFMRSKAITPGAKQAAENNADDWRKSL